MTRKARYTTAAQDEVELAYTIPAGQDKGKRGLVYYSASRYYYKQRMYGDSTYPNPSPYAQ